MSEYYPLDFLISLMLYVVPTWPIHMIDYYTEHWTAAIQKWNTILSNKAITHKIIVIYMMRTAVLSTRWYSASQHYKHSFYSCLIKLNDAPCRSFHTSFMQVVKILRMHSSHWFDFTSYHLHHHIIILLLHPPLLLSLRYNNRHRIIVQIQVEQGQQMIRCP